MSQIDVLIIGGGIQGLVLLDELTRSGYGCALVTNADLGARQTLHSHGLLNSGSGLLSGQMQAFLGLIEVLSGLARCCRQTRIKRSLRRICRV